jgi:hypothetical protein
MNRDGDLRPAAGFVNGILISLVFWAIVAAVVTSCWSAI